MPSKGVKLFKCAHRKINIVRGLRPLTVFSLFIDNPGKEVDFNANNQSVDSQRQG